MAAANGTSKSEGQTPSGGNRGGSSSSASKGSTPSERSGASSNSKGGSSASKGSSPSERSGGSGSSDRGGNGGSSDRNSAGGSKQDAAAQSKAAGIKDQDANPRAADMARQKDRHQGNAGTIASTLADKGWTDAQIDGALGRLQQESSLNPNAVRKDDNKKAAPGYRDSFGIAQWNGSRLAGLDKFAEARGKTRNDLETQAAYIDHEMRNRESFAGKQMQNAKTAAEAATAMMHYERPQGYTRSNPAAGHGYNNTQTYAANFAAGRGLNVTTNAATGAQQVAASSTAAQNLQRNPTTSTAYVDPMVSSAAGRQAAKGGVVNEAAKAVDSLLGTNIAGPLNTLNTPPQERERLGLGKLGTLAEKDDTLGVVKEVAGAIRDPLGFVLDSIEDGWNQAGGLKGITGKEFSFDFGSLGSGGGGAGGITSSGGDGSRITQRNSASAFQPVQDAAAQVAAIQPAKMKPFGWSKL